MKYLGIDYGTKYIGLAVSDDDGRMAFPRQVVATALAPSVIADMMATESIEAVVVGDSLDQSGAENQTAKRAQGFVARLGLEIPVHWQDERFTSLEASRHRYDNRPIANKRRSGKDHGRDDAGAATLILQRFLDSSR